MRGMIPDLFLKNKLGVVHDIPRKLKIFEGHKDKHVRHLLPLYLRLLPWANTPCKLRHMGERTPHLRIGWTHWESSRKKGLECLSTKILCLYIQICVRVPGSLDEGSYQLRNHGATRADGESKSSPAEAHLTDISEVILGGKYSY